MAPQPITFKFKFDPNQRHQLQAISSVIDLFDGMPFESIQESEALYAIDTVPNLLPNQMISEELYLENLQRIQKRNNWNDSSGDGSVKQIGLLEISKHLSWEDGFTNDPIEPGTWRYPSFVVEMETGTGKTYVYIRTIFELRKKYGFRKFIIVVPSVAIYEGVKKSFSLLKSHFSTLYDGDQAFLRAYDGAKLGSNIRDFATSKNTEILLMTVDSFNKTSNVIYNQSEKLPGEKLPFQYIQETRPILILDESQNYTSERSTQALRTLHPLFALEYSATPPKEHVNIVYRLTPFEALQQGLVKKIQVAGIVESDPDETQKIILEDVTLGSRMTATVKVTCIQDSQILHKRIVLHHGDDLTKKTGNSEYVGYIVSNIKASTKTVEFENGVTIKQSVTVASDSKIDVFKQQIKYTIEQHFDMQRFLFDQGLRVKVLSLFFIDRVANYTSDKPIIKELFTSLFMELSKKDNYYKQFTAEQVQKAYFAKKKNKDSSQEEAVDTAIEESEKKKEDREAEKYAYELIMKEKETLLSFEEPTCFVFAHSALKEGWDNPNVYQICTLNQSHSERRKRQEIGRGLRLAVDQEGSRIESSEHNILTVVANESYEEYVRTLQTEFREDGESEIPTPQNAFRAKARRTQKVFNREECVQFIDHLMKTTEYQIHFDSDDFIALAVKALNAAHFPEPTIVIKRGQFAMTEVLITPEKIINDYVVITMELINSADRFMNRKETFNMKIGHTLNSFLRWNHGELKDIGCFLNLFKLARIEKETVDQYIIFVNAGKNIPINIGECIRKRLVNGQQINERSMKDVHVSQEVPDFVSLAADETNLTRNTIIKIFNAIDNQQKTGIHRNSERWINIFIKILKETVANHVADKITYTVSNTKLKQRKDMLFPEVVQHSPGELIPGRMNRSLYDFIQIDSPVEKNFVQNHLNVDTNVVLYFKFPGQYKVRIPKIIGNYNPDWGIVRNVNSQTVTLELVRETKGGDERHPEGELRFTNERRKILCAGRHFQVLGINYREIRPHFSNWWLEKDDSDEKLIE